MKKIITTIVFGLLTISFLAAQSIPQGINYQAVARNAEGVVMANKSISLRLSLKTLEPREKSFYIETHQVTTNSLGLINLIIGEGNAIEGDFTQVPWSSQEIMMEIAMDEKTGNGYKIISTSKLLTVPYAFHAGSANELIPVNPDDGSRVPWWGQPWWNIQGLEKTDPDKHFLGNIDSVDLVVRTNDVERMRVLANGDVTVKNNVYLNTDSGETINYGPFTVDSLMPTILGGTLTVDLETDLNASLNVDGPTDLNSTLDVNNESPTSLSGTLLVEKDALFKEHVTLDNTLLSSDASTNGALVVAGGVGIGENLNVKKDLNIEGPSNNPNFPDSAKFYVHYDLAKFGVPVKFSAKTTFDAPVAINALDPFHETALIVTADVPTGSPNDPGHHVAHFENLDDGNGISIKVNSDNPANKNNFITFYGKSNSDPNKIVGRIEGELSTEYSNNADYLFDQRSLDYDIYDADLDLAWASIDVATTALKLIAAGTDIRACFGLGACTTTPGPVWVAFIAGEIISVGIKEGFAIDAKVRADDNKDLYNTNKDLYRGVTYASGAGDYAEYLLRADINESVTYGDIVGVNGGKISKNTKDAERMMVVSLKPIVLGNMPPSDRENEYEKVAFMGQVPVKVFGKVSIGDYIIPSGKDDGLGIAISPSKITTENINKIVGVAWTAVDDAFGFNMINVAVGLNRNDNNPIVEKLEKKVLAQAIEIDGLKQQMADVSAKLDQLLSGLSLPNSNQDIVLQKVEPSNNNTPVETEYQPHSKETIYINFTKNDMDAGLAMLINQLHEEGSDIEDNMFLNKLITNPDYKNKTWIKIKEKVEKAVDYHNNVMDSEFNIKLVTD